VHGIGPALAQVEGQMCRGRKQVGEAHVKPPLSWSGRRASANCPCHQLNNGFRHKQKALCAECWAAWRSGGWVSVLSVAFRGSLVPCPDSPAQVAFASPPTVSISCTIPLIEQNDHPLSRPFVKTIQRFRLA
jgi:hypothetical protein